MHMPEYFRKFGYKVPIDHHNGPFQWALDTKMSYFEMTQADPEKLNDFSVYMSGIRVTRKHWIEWFPVAEQLLSGFSGGKDDVLLVDMGGAYGHDLEKFLEKFPEAKGHLVLQDLPNTIGNITSLSEGIRAMPHDIFTEQSVKGARAYYTHFLFHDFPDEKCRQILCNLKSSMKPGYSKVLLNESILPERDCPAFFAAGDLNMMSCVAGIKRTEKQWAELVESAGLQLVKIWKSPFSGDEEGVVEAVLRE
ncbi:O-methyltransferase asqD [Lachnellula suecica]|uniref:O-methyltransferase asqD n=1 Tax=Lachnellula suecica TaxID=602035 RepID=A0A8T9C3G9_9HELO|nr:O-methyltransferase asqD [Lachnellula suecica]